MARIRVLQIITRFAVGGAQRCTLELARRLPADVYDVEVLAGADLDRDGNSQPEFTAAGRPVHVLPGLRREENPASDLAALWRLVGVIRRGRYDVVHTHMAKAGVIGRMAAGLAHRPVTVHTAHGWPWHNYLDRKTKEKYIGYERRAAARTDRIIVTNEKDRGKALANGIAPADRFTLIRSGIDLALFDPKAHDRGAARSALGIPERAPVIISVGALSEQKNPLEALQVVAGVRYSFPDLVYLWAGDGPLRASVEEASARLGLDDCVRWLGVRDDIPALLAAADVFLLTSKWEGLPRTLLEAMAMGKAVVCTQVDGVLDVVEDNVTGYIRDPEDVEELKAMVVRLFRAPNLITEMHAANTALIRRPEFSVERMVRETDELYRGLLAQRGRTP